MKTKNIEAEAEQLAVDVNGSSATWHLERDDGTLKVTMNSATGKVRCEWLNWDEDAQDWTGARVPYADVKHLIPLILYS